MNGEMAEHLGLDSDKNTFGDKASCRCIAKQYLWLADHAAKFISDRITAEDWKRIRRLLGSNARVPFASNRGTALVHEALESHFNRVAQS